METIYLGEIMDNIDIRNYIINNFKDESILKIRDSIETTIEERNEDALIGLGVLFEIVWTSIDDDTKNKSLNLILDKIKDLTM